MRRDITETASPVGQMNPALDLNNKETQEGGATVDLFDKCSGAGGSFAELRERGDRYFAMPELDPQTGVDTEFGGRDCVQWSLNNYLGLAQEEALRVAAV